jgi:nuclear transport factor 2 (NTF2) superfamily protein
MIKKWQIGDQIHDHNRGAASLDPEGSRDPGRATCARYWEFDNDGLMRLLLANINDLPIKEADANITGP